MQNRTTAMFLLMAMNCFGARVSPAAERAFQGYVFDLEARLARQHAKLDTYLTVALKTAPNDPASEDIQVEPVNGGTRQVGGALLHHWRGAAFVPNAMPQDMVKLLRDFNHLSKHYAPEVISSRVLIDKGESALLAVRFKEQSLLTVVLDAEYDIEIRASGNDRGYSVSRSTHMWEVDRPGTAQERRRLPGMDEGFLWHLNSYWSFARLGQGLQIECEAVSLTRDVPPGLGWLISPMIADFSRKQLAFTLKATKQALIANVFHNDN